MTSVIEFDKVSKRFELHRSRSDTLQGRVAGLLRPRVVDDAFWALRDVSFRIGRGESFGLVGHNGAGKSTALKLMTRILEPTSGSVQVHGRVAALLELGSGFHPDLSGRENVFLYGSLLGIGRRDMAARLEEIVHFADMADFLDMEVKHYSSGMYTRLAFAVATSVEPEVLITDEVLAVGDEAFQRKCMERIYAFRQMGRTIIFVSHALETVRALCDQAVWLDRGEPRLVGPAGAVIDAYLEDVNRREQEELARQPAGSASAGGQRFGNHEIEIANVELLGADGNAHAVFHTGDPFTVRIHYTTHTRVEAPIFGIGIHHEGGMLLSGPNTRFHGFDIPSVSGPGSIDYTIASLALLGGRYQLSVAIYDTAMLHPYDHHDRLYRFTVQSDGMRERFGIMASGGEWKITD